MRVLYGKRVKDYVGKREYLIILCSFILSLLVTACNDYLPLSIVPHLALCPVVGLLFGPFGGIGMTAAHLIYELAEGQSPAYCAVNAVTLFIVSYVPYRLWYSTWLTDDRPPVLDSVHNVFKFILTMLTSSLVYTVLYNIIYGMIDGMFILNSEDMVRFINIMAFSFLYGLVAILLLRYLGVSFYSPRFGGTPDGNRRDMDLRLYDLMLVLGLAVPPVVLNFTPVGLAVPAMGALTYAFIISFLLKPIEPARMNERTVWYRGMKVNTFKGSLIERIIVLFILCGLVICLLFGLAAYLGILADIFGWGEDITTVFYMGLGIIMFFIPALIFLWYIERNVTVPIGELSDASRNFISDDHEFSSEEFAYSCRDLMDKDSEIGELARSLTKMTGDMENYISNLRMLNSQQEMYRAEMNVAKNIQESFVPTNFSIVEGSGASVAASMDAAKYVGGDFYDFYMIDTDHMAVTIGDVSGKGVPAALFMAVTKSLIEGQSRPGMTPGEILGKVNLALCRNNQENMFVTVWFGILELATGRLTFCSAGHNPPVMVRAGEEPELLHTKPSLVLGAREGVKYSTSEIVMGPGDRILLYTDGVTEANDHYSEFYGLDRLMSMLKEGSEKDLHDQVRTITDDINSFTHDAQQFDDITLLLLRYDGHSRKPLLDREDVAVPVADVADPVDVLLREEDAQAADGTVPEVG